MKKVALFFGSFNPIHNGHLILANYIAEYAGVDEVRFVVSPQNPFKENRSLMPDDLRLRMVQTAICDYPKFSATDVEFSLTKPSYTCQTLQYLSEQYPEDEFLLIMGGDNLPTFDKWKNAEWIAENFKILVYPRPGEPMEVPLCWRKSVTLLENAPLLDVSSTMVRRAKKEGRNLRFFLAKGVWEMMDELDFSSID